MFRIVSGSGDEHYSTDAVTHRILAAGDLNTFYNATDDNRLVLAARDRLGVRRRKRSPRFFWLPFAEHVARTCDTACLLWLQEQQVPCVMWAPA